MVWMTWTFIPSALRCSTSGSMAERKAVAVTTSHWDVDCSVAIKGQDARSQKVVTKSQRVFMVELGNVSIFSATNGHQTRHRPKSRQVLRIPLRQLSRQRIRGLPFLRRRKMGL